MKLRCTLWKNFKLFLLFAFLSSPAFAQSDKMPEEEIPAGLDFDRRQAESARFETTPFGGDYFGDKLNHSFVVGGDIQFNLTEKLGLSADFAWSQASADKTGAFGASLANNNLYLVDGGFVVTVPAIYRSKKGYTEADFYTSLGAGLVRVNGSNRLGGFIGGGMKIRPKIKWLAIRIDLRNYFTSVPNPSGSDFEDDLTIRIGPTFLLPPYF